MANYNFKGRQKGTVKKRSMIEDPAMGNYKIIIDEDSYNLVFTEPKTKKEKPMGYYTHLSSALKRIAKEQVTEKKSNYTIKEYITELETTLNNLKTLINHE
jgi:hypothetical protein